jgi:hypothetical protein
MNQDLNRVKHDLETMQKAMGLDLSLGREWIQWMKRDKWLSLWWCLPGLILIASTLIPFDNSVRHLGLVAAQWTGILTAAAMLAITVLCLRKTSSQDGRPESLLREYKRVNGLTAQGAWFSVALFGQLALYFIWIKQHQISFGAFWSGLFIFMGSTCLVTALTSRAWLLLGWALPFLAYGLFETLLPGAAGISGIPLGIMFIAVALSFSIIHVFQIRALEIQHHGAH